MKKNTAFPHRFFSSVSFQKKMIFLFFIFLLAGIFLFNCIFIPSINDFLFFSDLYLSQFQETDFSFPVLFVSILKNRGMDFLFLFFIGNTRLKRPFFSLCCCWYGLSYGILSAFCCFKFHYFGSLLFFAMLLPYFPFYLAAFIMMSSMLPFSKSNSSRSISYYALILLLLSFLVITGCILESFLSPLLIKKVLSF